MKIALLFFAAALCFVLSSCHRPVALFQPVSRPAAARFTRVPTTSQAAVSAESITGSVAADAGEPDEIALVSRQNFSVASAERRMATRTRHVRTMLNSSGKTNALQPEPRQPKPKKQLRLGNRIRQGLGLPLRKELNWWQRISWKLKVGVIVILLAVVFALFNVTILAIIFGLLGAFLLISGLKRSFKVRRPWF